MESVELRALKDQADRTDMQQLNIREELMQAEAHGPKIRVRLWTGNHSEAEGDEHKATHLPFWNWCTCSKAECEGQPHRCCSSERVMTAEDYSDPNNDKTDAKSIRQWKANLMPANFLDPLKVEDVNSESCVWRASTGHISS